MILIAKGPRGVGGTEFIFYNDFVWAHVGRYGCEIVTRRSGEVERASNDYTINIHPKVIWDIERS